MTKQLNVLEQTLYDKTLSCVHCGLCLPACPTYEAKPRESLAPRGQIYNVRALLEGRLELTPTLSDDIYQCLACRGCESVCPAGVPVGSIMEDARELIFDERVEPRTSRLLKRLLLGGVIARPKVLAVAMAGLRLYQSSGLSRVVGWLLETLSSSLAARHRLMPEVEKKPLFETVIPPKRDKRGRVALFTGCVASYMYSDVNRATARVLSENGYEVVVPTEQGCCGALHLHNGLVKQGKRLAKANIAEFAKWDVDAIIVNGAGCGAAMIEYGELLAADEDPARLDRARAFATRVADVSLFLVREGFRAPSAPAQIEPIDVVYDAPCHLFHAQRVKKEPEQLLRSIPGVRLVEVANAERCCGSAGIYNVTQHDMSMRILDSKMRQLAPEKPHVIATGNPGCQIQLSEGVRRAELFTRVTHPIVLLDEAYRAENLGSKI